MVYCAKFGTSNCVGVRVSAPEDLKKFKAFQGLLNHRDVRNRFLNFGSVSVRFLKKTRIRFGMNLVRFGSVCKNSVRFG